MNIATRPILLVEDESNDIVLVQRAFARANILNPLEIVRDGDEAVDYLGGTGSYGDRQQHPFPSIVLLDLKLPRRPGLDVLRWTRDRPGLKRMPIIILTSSRQNTEIDRAYELGANSFLVKPVTFEDLLNLIKVLKAYWLTLNEYPAISP
jgi:CheY-like chemotaxis protein